MATEEREQTQAQAQEQTTVLDKVLDEVVEQTQTQKTESDYDRLMRLGLSRAAAKISRIEKMKTAYSKYLYVTQERLDRFNDKLRKETLEENRHAYHYKKLVFIPLNDYPEIPPPNVLEALDRAKADNCFDTFEVAKIEWRVEVKDPILFGAIEGCTDKFFISQWDDDVSLEEILFMD